MLLGIGVVTPFYCCALGCCCCTPLILLHLHGCVAGVPHLTDPRFFRRRDAGCAAHIRRGHRPRGAGRRRRRAIAARHRALGLSLGDGVRVFGPKQEEHSRMPYVSCGDGCWRRVCVGCVCVCQRHAVIVASASSGVARVGYSLSEERRATATRYAILLRETYQWETSQHLARPQSGTERCIRFHCPSGS